MPAKLERHVKADLAAKAEFTAKLGIAAKLERHAKAENACKGSNHKGHCNKLINSALEQLVAGHSPFPENPQLRNCGLLMACPPAHQACWYLNGGSGQSYLHILHCAFQVFECGLLFLILFSTCPSALRLQISHFWPYISRLICLSCRTLDDPELQPSKMLRKAAIFTVYFHVSQQMLFSRHCFLITLIPFWSVPKHFAGPLLPYR